MIDGTDRLDGIFISYAREDTDLVVRLDEQLRREGRPAWVDTERLRGGQVYWDRIREAIDRSVAFLVVISPDSVVSEGVAVEIERALDGSHAVVPLLLRAVDWELGDHTAAAGRLQATYQMIDFSDEHGFDDAYSELRATLDNEWDDAETSARLRTLAREWDAAGRDDGATLSAARLREFEEWLARGVGGRIELTELQRSLLLASQEKLRADQERLEQALAASRREQWRARAGELASLAIADADVHPQRSLLLAAEALRAAHRLDPPPPAAEQALREVLGTVGGRRLGQLDQDVQDMAVDAGGRWAATVGRRGAVEVTDLHAPGHPADNVHELYRGIQRPGGGGRNTTRLAFNPDGSQLAVGGWADGTVRLWHLDGGGDLQAQVLEGARDTITGLDFSPDGRWLLGIAYPAIGEERVESDPLLWDVSGTPATRVLLPGHEAVEFGAFAPGGRFVFTADGATDGPPGRLWDLTTEPATAHVLDAAGSEVRAAIWAGDTLLTHGRSDDGSVLVRWRLEVDNGGPVGDHLVTGATLHSCVSDRGSVAVGVARNGDAPEELLLFGPDDDDPQTLLGGAVEGFDTLMFGPDDRWLFAALADGAPRLWRLDPDVQEYRLDAHQPFTVRAVKLDRSGDGPIPGHRIVTNPSVSQAAFDAAGRRLATGGYDGEVLLWDLSAADPSSRPRRLAGHGQPVGVLHFGADGLFASGGGSNPNTSVADNRIQVTYLDGSPRRATLTGHEGAVEWLGGDTTSRWLVSRGRDDTARVWDTITADAVPRVLVPSGADVNSLVVAGDRVIAGRDDGEVVVADLGQSTFATLPGLDFSVAALAASPDGAWVAGASPTVRDPFRIWSTADPAAPPHAVFHPHDHDELSQVSALHWSRGGRFLVSGDSQGRVAVFDTSRSRLTQEPVVVEVNLDGISCFATDPGDRWLAVGTGWYMAVDGISFGGRIYLFELPTRGRDHPKLAGVLEGHGMSVRAMMFTPDGTRLLSGAGTLEPSPSGSLRLWDLTDEGFPSLAFPGHQEGVLALDVSADGRWLLTGGEDGSASMWDLTAPDPTSSGRVLAGHEGEVNAVALGNGGLAVTACEDRTVRLWRPGASAPVVLAGHSDPVTAVAFDQDETTVISASRDGTCLAWGLDEGPLVDAAMQRAGRNLTQDEWRRYLPDEPYRATFPELPVEPDRPEPIRRGGRGSSDLDEAIAATDRERELTVTVPDDGERLVVDEGGKFTLEVPTGWSIVETGHGLVRLVDLDGETEFVAQLGAMVDGQSPLDHLRRVIPRLFDGDFVIPDDHVEWLDTFGRAFFYSSEAQQIGFSFVKELVNGVSVLACLGPAPQAERSEELLQAMATTLKAPAVDVRGWVLVSDAGITFDAPVDWPVTTREAPGSTAVVATSPSIDMRLVLGRVALDDRVQSGPGPDETPAAPADLWEAFAAAADREVFDPQLDDPPFVPYAVTLPDGSDGVGFTHFAVHDGELRHGGLEGDPGLMDVAARLVLTVLQSARFG